MSSTAFRKRSKKPLREVIEETPDLNSSIAFFHIDVSHLCIHVEKTERITHLETPTLHLVVQNRVFLACGRARSEKTLAEDEKDLVQARQFVPPEAPEMWYSEVFRILLNNFFRIPRPCSVSRSSGHASLL